MVGCTADIRDKRKRREVLLKRLDNITNQIAEMEDRKSIILHEIEEINREHVGISGEQHVNIS